MQKRGTDGDPCPSLIAHCTASPGARDHTMVFSQLWRWAVLLAPYPREPVQKPQLCPRLTQLVSNETLRPITGLPCSKALSALLTAQLRGSPVLWFTAWSYSAQPLPPPNLPLHLSPTHTDTPIPSAINLSQPSTAQAAKPWKTSSSVCWRLEVI